MHPLLYRLSRRHLFQAAGGITYLALTSDGRIARAASRRLPPVVPVFSVLPYLQPGPGGPLQEGAESMVLAWETNRVAATFSVEWGEGRALTDGKREPTRTERYTVGKEDGKAAYHYAATLTGLSLAKRYRYRVRMGGQTLVEGFFTTRSPRGSRVRFVAFGDNSLGDIHERMIAYQAYRARPAFIVNTGDNVYENGLCNEYSRYFFPIYNAEMATPRSGAPLLRSVPFYTVLANHDYNTNPSGGPVCDFNEDPDCLGYFQCLHLPLNGPDSLPHPMPLTGKAEQLEVFRRAAGERYPRMGSYSFDYGDGHFLCLDSNVYVDPTDEKLQAWVQTDLAHSDAAWKFVVFHHPCFNAGWSHYRQQHMRVLAPLFERHGVSVVLHGHEHTYQRTRPLRFAPSDTSRAAVRGSGDRLVPGTFTVDRVFDGERSTRAEGVIYLTTGAAGKYLYNAEVHENPARWRHPEDGNLDYVARFIADRFSFTVFDMEPKRLTLRQLDQWGNQVDQCQLTR